MIIYLLLFALIFTPLLNMVYVYDHKRIHRSKIQYTSKVNYCLFIGICLVTLMFLKHDYVGTDTQNYRMIFDSTLYHGLPNEITFNTEIGFILLQLLLGSLGLGFRSLLLVNAILYTGAIVLIIIKYSKTPWLSFFLFMTLGNFIFHTTMRQCFALSFTIYALIVVVEKNIRFYKFWSVFLWILAITFHTSALIFGLVYILVKVPYSKLLIFASIVTSVFLHMFGIPIVNFILLLLNNTQYQSMETGGYKTLLIYLALVVVGIIYNKKFIVNGNKFDGVIFNLLLLSVVIFPLAQYNQFFFRLLNYFTIYIIIYVPNLIHKVNDKLLKNTIFFLFILYGLGSFFYMSRASGVRVWPYIFFFQDYPVELIPAGLLQSGTW